MPEWSRTDRTERTPLLRNDSRTASHAGPLHPRPGCDHRPIIRREASPGYVLEGRVFQDNSDSSTTSGCLHAVLEVSLAFEDGEIERRADRTRLQRDGPGVGRLRCRRLRRSRFFARIAEHDLEERIGGPCADGSTPCRQLERISVAARVRVSGRGIEEWSTRCSALRQLKCPTPKGRPRSHPVSRNGSNRVVANAGGERWTKNSKRRAPNAFHGCSR